MSKSRSRTIPMHKVRLYDTIVTKDGRKWLHADLVIAIFRGGCVVDRKGTPVLVTDAKVTITTD